MSGLGRFGGEVAAVVPVLTDFQGHTLGYSNIAGLHHRHFGGIVGQQTNGRESKLLQDVRAQPKIPFIILKPQPMIGLHRIKTLILERIGAHLVGQPNASPFLTEVEQDACALGPHLGQRPAQLRAAIAFQTAHHVAGKTGGMQAGQDGFAAVGSANLDSKMLFPAIIRAEHMQAPRLGRFHRQSGMHHGMQRAAVDQEGLCQDQGQAGQPVLRGKARAVLDLYAQRRGQQSRRLTQLHGRAVSRSVAFAHAGEWPFHGGCQVIRWISQSL
mmetsp:Transcript_114/g.332  ORF Transcript_114/g.332 Transcript_114/m.332 type:complete len:271 (-) Transcript_114:415-1227(-)